VLLKKITVLIGIIGIFVICQTLSAQTWEKTKRLTWNSGTSQTPQIATDSNNHIHAIWSDSSPGNQEIYYKKSTNGGSSWSFKRLTSTSGSSIHPAIMVDASDNIHVLWADETPGNYEIYYTKSTNGGGAWGSPKRLSWNSENSYNPAIETDSTNIHIVWDDYSPGKHQIYYRKSTNSGGTWGGTKRLTWNTGSSLRPSIAVDSSSTIYVVWEDSAPGNTEILYKISTNGGANWSNTKRLSWNSGSSNSPKIAIDSSDRISVVWNDDTPGNSEIYFRKSTSSGATWGSTKRLTWNLGYSGCQRIAVDSTNGIYIVWCDDSPGNYEIYYKRSTNSGGTWGGVKRLTWNTGGSGHPAMALDSSKAIHIVWMDDITGNREIYYKKGIQ
jgi:hypothetical protein